MRRCLLKGLAGDATNVVLAAAGSNLRKLLDAIASALMSRLWSYLAAARRTQTIFLRPLLTA